ncbi:MAG TPA: Hsp33 family molecular chaperone HslO [Gallionellaceae bacterium]|nr:Hsp33 family molecular chaperone HslO [Gallionellaceae bacterium]
MKHQPDALHRFLFENAAIRGERVHLDAAWRTVLERHNYPPVLVQLMGELSAAAVLLAATLKLQGSLILQIQGKGAIKLLVVECTGDLQLRATAKWEGELHGDLAEMVGDGRFVITLDPKSGAQAYQGIVALEGGSVADILQHYMARSEQLETRLWLAADEHGAAGMLLQKLPEQQSHDPDAWDRVTKLGETLKREELLQLPTLELLHRLYHEEDVRLFEAQPVSFHCGCSREKVAAMLKMLGQEEIEGIVEEQGRVEIHCEFCNQRYEFDPVDAAMLFTEGISPDVGETRH